MTAFLPTWRDGDRDQLLEDLDRIAVGIDRQQPPAFVLPKMPRRTERRHALWWQRLVEFASIAAAAAVLLAVLTQPWRSRPSPETRDATDVSPTPALTGFAFHVPADIDPADAKAPIAVSSAPTPPIGSVQWSIPKVTFRFRTEERSTEP